MRPYRDVMIELGRSGGHTWDRPSDDGTCVEVYRIETIWKAAEQLPSEPMRVSDFKELDRPAWVPPDPRPWANPGMTLREFVVHCKRIRSVSVVDYPHILVGPDGFIIDGLHRLASHMEVLRPDEWVPGKRFLTWPEPDFRTEPYGPDDREVT